MGPHEIPIRAHFPPADPRGAGPAGRPAGFGVKVTRFRQLRPAGACRCRARGSESVSCLVAWVPCALAQETPERALPRLFRVRPRSDSAPPLPIDVTLGEILGISIAVKSAQCED